MLFPFRHSAAVLCVSFFVAAACGFAQLTQSTLKGAVTDPSGSAIGASQIALKNDSTGETRSTQTDNSGAFVMTALNPGNYTLTVSATGFGTKEQRELVLNVGRITEVNVKLEVATQQTEIGRAHV